MKKRTRWILIGVAAAVVLLVLSLTASDGGIEVEAVRVERGPLSVAVVEEGRTRVRDRYVVAAPVTGRLARIAVDEGDPVAEGDLIARLYPTPTDSRTLGVARAQAAAAEARRREAIARLDEAQARAEQLEREAARTAALVADSILSNQEGEQAALAVATARQQVRAAEATRRAAEADLAAARAALTGASPQDEGLAVPVYAPSAGRVLRVLEENERVVPAGTPLVEIGDVGGGYVEEGSGGSSTATGGLEVVVDVLSEDAVRIAPGAPIRIEEWGGDGTLEGRVRLVEPDAFTEVSALGVEEQRVNVIADLFDPPPSLGAGYRVEAHIVTWQGEGVLTVPTSALFQREGTWAVFAVEDGEAALRTVRVGHRSAEAAEIVEGLAEGDAVILFPSDQIEDGVRVRSD
ncbi:MAG: HlyD family efflux transporter periplasmic adaptor subunit [Rhodothermales bacterium]